MTAGFWYPNSVVEAAAKGWDVVVDAAGRGDAFTIQGGIDLLGPLGGTVFVRAGTYLITAPIVLPDVPVRLVGAAQGSFFAGPGVTVDLGALNISAFSFPAALTAGQFYEIDGFRILGTAAGTQTALRVQSGVDLNVVNCNFTAIDIVTDATGAFVTQRFSNCSAISADTLFTSDMPGFSVLEIDDCTWFLNGGVGIAGEPNILSTNTAFSTFAGPYSINMAAESRFSTCRFQGGTVTVGNDRCTFVGCTFQSTPVTITAGDDQCVFSGCMFRSTTTGIAIASVRHVVSGCSFQTVTNAVVESGAADFNLYVANNGFAAPTIIGAGSLAASNIA